jgi:TRAP-type transport system small permease protein
VSGAVILLNDLWRLLTGKLSEDELIGIRESEEAAVNFDKPVH